MKKNEKYYVDFRSEQNVINEGKPGSNVRLRNKLVKASMKKHINEWSHQSMIELEAKRVKETEGLYKGYWRTEFYKHGSLFAIIPAESKQPRKDIKTVIINCWKWSVKWIHQ